MSWDSSLPKALVVACSDGRIHAAIELFIQNDLHIDRYDRMYVPGGAGALAPSGAEFARAHQHHRECRFLIEAHELDTVVLLFHGPSSDGPSDALCGDYCRKFPGASGTEIRRAQDQDLHDVLRLGTWREMRIVVARYEVTKDGDVRFITLHDSAEHNDDT